MCVCVCVCVCVCAYVCVCVCVFVLTREAVYTNEELLVGFRKLVARELCSELLAFRETAVRYVMKARSVS